MIKHLLEERKSTSNKISGFARFVPDWSPAGMEETEAGPWAECLWGVWGVESGSSRLRATCLQHLRLCVYWWRATHHLPDLLFGLLTAVTEHRCLLSWVSEEFPHGRCSELGGFKVIRVLVSLR